MHSPKKGKSSKPHTFEDCQIIYGRSETKFGDCVMALKENQICFVSFVDGIFTDITELRKTFPKAVFINNDELIKRKVEQYFEGHEKPQVYLTGTDFQIKVWEYLVSLPRGKTTYYGNVAKSIGQPNAIRAVASAIAKNKVAYFVPCHRVISKNGNLNKYKWGSERKLRMLNEEKAI